MFKHTVHLLTISGAYVDITNLPASVTLHEDAIRPMFLYSIRAYSPSGEVTECDFDPQTSNFNITPVGNSKFKQSSSKASHFETLFWRGMTK